jgi:hypothetical protein
MMAQKMLSFLFVLAAGAATAQDKPAEAPKLPDPLVSPAPYPDLLMLGLDDTASGEALRRAGINMRGYIEQSFTLTSHSGDINELRVFDNQADDYMLNQVMLILDRTMPGGSGFDLDGRVDLMYGSDANLIHAAGWTDQVFRSDDVGDTDLDIVQLYGRIRLPIGNGLMVKGGKWVTIFGNEVIEAPLNRLFSRSYNFGFGIPFTHTGMILTYPFDGLGGSCTVSYAWTFGWDVFEDPNGGLTHMGQFTYARPDNEWTAVVNFAFGPEFADNDSDDRVLGEILFTYNFTGDLQGVLDLHMGHNEDDEGVTIASDADWGGVAAYLTYVFCREGDKPDGREVLSGTFRGEWFYDDGGFRTGVDGSLFGFTAGVNWRPWNFLHVRPEVRYDVADGDNEPFDGGSDDDMFTFGIDVIFLW